MRSSLIVLALAAALASAPAQPTVDLDNEKAEILHIHELDRAAHLNDNAADLVSRLAPELLSVAEGKIIRQSRDENRKLFEEYFRGSKHTAWDDLEPPIVRISPDGRMAWAVYRVHSRYEQTKDGKKEVTDFVAAWMSAYEKRNGKWEMTAVASTFEPNP
jgi:ketosteroid isomerase-like protein